VKYAGSRMTGGGFGMNEKNKCQNFLQN
jgi:hypothetical protein